MKLSIKPVQLDAGKPIAIINKHDAKLFGIHPSDRLLLTSKHTSEVAIADVTEGWVKKGQVALSRDIINYLNVAPRQTIDVIPAPFSQGGSVVKSRIRCEPYTREQLRHIIKDIVSNALTEAEVAYFISGVNYCGMTLEETTFLIDAIVSSGRTIHWGAGKIADKHSIGGIPGNRTTPIVVAICAALGVTMPKTSSRAITSAAGTADTVETIAPVDFSLEELKSIVKKTGGCLAWGGALGLAPADDKLIQVEKMLNLDPEPQLLASILAKKIAVGSKYVLIDIPHGQGAKVNRKQALGLKKKFLVLAKKLKLHLEVVLTDGSQPIGNGMGPMLEMKDVIRVLQRDNPPRDLEKKSILLAGKILEMVGKARKGKGWRTAQKALDDGIAFAKFKQIIEAQGGSLKNIRTAPHQKTLLCSRTARVKSIHNRSINILARTAGCPQDKTAGVYLHAHVGTMVKKGEPLITVYAESPFRLRTALEFLQKNHPIELE